MALSAGQVKSVELYSGVESQVIAIPQGTSTTSASFYQGDLVTLTSGLVTGVADHDTITGIAATRATAVDYAGVPIALLDPAAIYVMRVGSAQYSVRTILGQKFDVVFTVGLQRVDTGTTGNDDIYIVAIHPSDKHADGSTGILEGRVLVRFSYTNFIGL